MHVISCAGDVWHCAALAIVRMKSFKIKSEDGTEIVDLETKREKSKCTCKWFIVEGFRIR